ncbi:MAG: hypothetical protein WCP55_02990 [Lentisphaerota bacterium]
MATKSAEQEIEERSKLAGNNQFELLLFRLGESKNCKTGLNFCVASISS